MLNWFSVEWKLRTGKCFSLSTMPKLNRINSKQIRHYMMHFWQQLPKHVTIYVDLMHSLDAHMYSLLMNIYLSIDAPEENLRRLNTMAYLIPMWLTKTFQHIPYAQEWSLQFNNGIQYGTSTSVGQIKTNEALRWKCRIKFTVDLLIMLKVTQ